MTNFLLVIECKNNNNVIYIVGFNVNCLFYKLDVSNWNPMSVFYLQISIKTDLYVIKHKTKLFDSLVF